MRDEHTPAQVRNYCNLSPLTRDELGRCRENLTAELHNAEHIFNNHESDHWSTLPQEDYDTEFPELQHYITTLRNLLGFNN